MRLLQFILAAGGASLMVSSAADAQQAKAPAAPPRTTATAPVSDGDCVALTQVAAQAKAKQTGKPDAEAVIGSMFFTGRLSARDAGTARSQIAAAKSKLKTLNSEQAQAMLNGCSQIFRDNIQRIATYAKQ